MLHDQRPTSQDIKFFPCLPWFLIRQPIAVVILAVLLTDAEGAEKPLAWISFADQAVQEYDNTPYLWLGDQPIYLTIDVAPADEYAIDLLWGAKNDQRAADVTVNETRQHLEAGGYNGFRWQRVTPAKNLTGEKYDLLLQAAQPKAAFLAAVRLVEDDAPLDQALPAAAAYRMKITGPPPTVLDVWMEQLQDEDLDGWQRAEIYGRQANEALRRCRKYVDGWLAHADPKSGLIPRNLGKSNYYWNGRDSGADNYAFMVLTCALTDRAMYEGRMLDMLRTETKLASRMGALPADYDFNKQGFRFAEPDLNRLIFDGSEYVKDGLMPITEWLGHTPWSDRMIAIEKSIMDQAAYETPFGRLPSDNVEVNGEMMQVLSRLCFMTGDKNYLELACCIADYYLLGDHHPTRDGDTLKLRDHGCELISGLTEVYAACHFLRKNKAQAYREPIHSMLDRILEVGINEHGLMYDMINPKTGEILRSSISDNWGYDYNGFYTVCLLDGIERYREATRRAMVNLKPYYWEFAWEGASSDGIADSVEGAINLFNREPDVEGVAEWIDANTARMLLIQKPDGVIEGWHGDGNYARTAILWALMKQQGVTIQPWREDVRLGAVRDGTTLRLVVTAEQPWQGKLIFDQPRHKTVMRMPLDYPRINQFPEWFTVEASDRLAVAINDKPQTRTGEELTKGLPLTLDAGQAVQLVVRKAE